MSERSKEHDWKSCVPRKGTMGSNPILCASLKARRPCDGLLLFAASGTPQKPFAGNGLSCSESEIAEIT